MTSLSLGRGGVRCSRRWGRIVYRRRRLVLVIAAAGRGRSPRSGAPACSARCSRRADSRAGTARASRPATWPPSTFGRDSGDVVVLYSSPDQTVGRPRFRSAVTGTLAALPPGKVPSYATYWSTGVAAVRQHQAGSETYAVIELAGPTATRPGSRATTRSSGKPGRPGPDHPDRRRSPRPRRRSTSEVTSDIGRAEGLSMPMLLILLLLIFGGLAAASLPLAIGGIAILGSFTALRLLTLGTAVVDLLDQHHHDPRARPGDRLRAVHRRPVPRGTARPADSSRTRWPGPWPPLAARSRSPASPSRSRWPA